MPSLIGDQILPIAFPPAPAVATVSRVAVLAPALSASSPTPQQITLTATISGAPTGGTVNFNVAGAGTVNNVPVVNGVAQVVFTIPLGTPATAGGTVTSTYSGTAGFAGSTSTGAGNGTLTFCMHDNSTLLGSTLQTFAVLAGSTVTNVGPTIIVGNVGVSEGSAITGFPPGMATGTFHRNDAVAIQAQLELTTAYNTILNETVGFTNLTGQDLGGLTLTPGRYHFDVSAQLTGTLVLDNQNDPDARFDFQIGSTLTTASGSRVLFINGGADNVYWQVGTSAIIGSSTAFAGNILANASISLNSTASVACGRLLARSGAVTLINNFIDPVAGADATVVVAAGCGCGTRGGPASTSLPVADNAGPGFSVTGTGWSAPVGIDGYNGTYQFAAAGSGSNTATWSFAVTPGRYRVSTTWSPHAIWATNAPYTVLDESTVRGTVAINQEMSPNDTTALGFSWEYLGAFDIGSKTLRVTLSNQANEYVIADAVRIERLGDLPNIIDNLDPEFSSTGFFGPVGITAYEGSYHYAPPGSGTNTANWTFTVEPGVYRVSATWSEASVWATNSPYTVLDGSTVRGTTLINQELAPNDATAFGASWEFLGTFNIGSNTLGVRLADMANQYVTADAVRIERLVDLPNIIDNLDPGFTSTGFVGPVGITAYEGSYHYAPPGSGANTANWSFAVEPGVYRVSATWSEASVWATNSPYTILDGTTVRGTTLINQEMAPNDATAFGASWEFLGTFNIGSNTLGVRLSDMANQFVTADAVRIERLGDLPRVVDNADTGFSLSGPGWSPPVGNSAYNGSYRLAAPGSGANTATWTFAVEPGQYRVSATWIADSVWATNSPFTVFDGATVEGTTLINQELVPNDASEFGVNWEFLGTFTIDSNTLKVVFSNLANEYVIADAVRIERVG